ncbi:hypothetical protein HanPI659440_Chr08g0309691 [Helianthus annuus]|nr:hypothetical protein HanPI659440_Chr08g0309691 [Helianthus annuus]
MVNNVTTSVPDRVVCERAVNVEEFRKIGIVQMFERQGWERVLDWCEDNTSRVYLADVCEWLASLRFMNRDGPPAQWRLVGRISRGEMTTSFKTINCIALILWGCKRMIIQPLNNFWITMRTVMIRNK